jgi:hypothetical protein
MSGMTVLPPDIKSNAVELAIRTPFSAQCMLDAATVLWVHGYPKDQIVSTLDQLCQTAGLAPWTPLHAVNALVQVLQLDPQSERMTP